MLGLRIVKEGEDKTLRFDCENCSFFPSLEDNDSCMVAVINALIENPSATRVAFSQKREYEYDYDQTGMLMEIANLQTRLSRQKFFYTERNRSDLFIAIKTYFIISLNQTR